MTHGEIEAGNLTERYVAGKLAAEEVVRFEDHFVDCAHCLDQVESAQRLRAGLKTLEPQPVVRHGPRVAWLAVAAALVLTAGTSIWLATRSASLQRELEQSRLALADWKQRYEALRSNQDRPLLGSTFILNTMRGAEQGASDPANRIVVPGTQHWVVLSLDRDLEPGFQSLRASLEDASNKQIWQQAGLVSTAGVPVSVVLPSQLLSPGDYVLVVEGMDPSSQYRAAGRYRFRVSRR